MELMPEEKKDFKRTEVGAIPEDWDVLNIGDILKLKSGYAFSSEYYSDYGPILLTPGNFKLTGGLYFNDRNTKRFSGEYSRNQVFSKGDLLVVMTDLTPDCNLLGKPAVVDVDEPVLHNQRIGKIELFKPNISEDFLYYYFLSSTYLDHIKNTSTGSTVSHTSNGSIYASKISLPPTLKEQQAIASALSDVDKLIRSLDQLIQKKEAIKKGTMQQLLTGKKRLRGFDGEWEVKRLGDVCQIISGGTPSTKNSEYWDGDIEWCTPTDITSNKGKYLSKTSRKITAQGLQNSSATLLPEGTLLFCSRATVGEVKIAETEISTNQGFKSLICSESVDNEFLYYLVILKKQKFIDKAFGSTFLEISKKNTADIEFYFPYVEEQKAIARILSDMDRELQTLRQKREKYVQIKQGMMQELLTGKTRLI